MKTKKGYKLKKGYSLKAGTPAHSKSRMQRLKSKKSMLAKKKSSKYC